MCQQCCPALSSFSSILFRQRLHNREVGFAFLLNQWRIQLKASLVVLIRFSLSLLLLLMALSAQAQSASTRIGVNIQAVLGFSETFRLGHWTPLTVTLTNHGKNLVAQLNVEVVGGDEFQGGLFTTYYRRDVQLPQNARKRFHFTVFLDNPSRPLTIRINSAGTELAQQTTDLRQRFTDAQLILVLSRDADLDYLNTSGSTHSLRVLYPHPELLPERWQGYDGIAAIIIHGLSLESLSIRQFEAIQKWLAQGGTVAVSADPNYTLLRTPRLAELVPATPVGIASLADASIESQHKHLNNNNAPRSFDVHRLVQVQGRTLYRAGEFPLLIEQKTGRGKVLYLSFDVARAPFANWSGIKQFWLENLQLPTSTALSLTPVKGAAENPIFDIIRRAPKSFPPHSSVLIFLVLYLGVLATGYRLAASTETQQPQRKKLLWLSGIAPLVFACAAFLLFGPGLFPKGDNAVILTTLKPFPQSNYAHVRLDLGLYSMRSAVTYPALDFAYEGIQPVFSPARQFTSFQEAKNWVFHEDNFAFFASR